MEPANLRASLEGAQKEVNDEINRIFADNIERAAKIDRCCKNLLVDMRKVMTRDNKRYWSFLACTSYAAYGGSDRKMIISAAAALEVLCASAIVQGDVVAQRSRRNGVANINGIYEKRLRQPVHPVYAQQIANGIAQVAGNIGASVAGEQIIFIPNISSETSRMVQTIFGQIVFEVNAGRQFDLLLTLDNNLSLKKILKATRYRPGAYFVGASLRLGATLAGIDPRALARLDAAGEYIGLSYQLVEEVLNSYANARTLGMPIASDLREGKQTALMFYGLKFADEKQRAYLLQKHGNSKVSSDEIGQVRAILAECGARAKTMVLAKEYSEKARQEIDQLQADQSALSLLRDFNEYCLERKF